MRLRRHALTTRGRAFLACGATLGLGGTLLGFPDLTRVGMLLVGLPLVGLALVRRAPALSVDRTISPMPVTLGENATVLLRATNTGSRGTGLLLAEDLLPPVLGECPRFVLGALAPGSARAATYDVHPLLRGHHPIGPLAVAVRDPFGLTHRHVEVGGRGELVVLPRTVPLGGSRPPGTGIGAEGEIPHMVALHGEDDQSIREYRDGDDLRRIHWPATARVGELMVRQEDRPARRRAVVLLDSRSEAHRGEGLHSSFEWGVSAVASVVVHLTSLGYAVHLVTDQTVADAAADTPVDPIGALDVLADARLGSVLGLAEATRAAQTLAAAGGLLVAVLADADGAAVQRVAGIRAPGSTAVALLLDPSRFGEGRGRTAPPTGAGLDTLRGAGWSTTVVGADTSVEAAWSAVSRSGRWVARAGSSRSDRLGSGGSAGGPAVFAGSER